MQFFGLKNRDHYRDFQNKILSSNPSHELCRIYIKALIDIANGDFHKYETNVFEKLERALDLSIKLNDDSLIENCKIALINFENRHSQDSKQGLWGYSFDLLFGNKKIKLSKKEESDIVNELEAKLNRLTSTDLNGQKIDPWAAEVAAKRLAVFYRKNLKYEDVKRVILKVGDAFNRIINKASAMQASAWLENLNKLYTEFSLKEEAEQILQKIRELEPKMVSELKSISHTVKIPNEKMEEYINAMTSGSIEEILRRISIRYIPNKEEAKKQIFDLSKKAPLSYLFVHKLQDERGRLIATVDSLENDLEGHIVLQVSQYLSFSSLFLRLVIEEVIKKFNLNKNDVLKFIERTPIIQRKRLEIIDKGLDAYFANNYLIAIHLIIPQIEEAIRNIVEFGGGNIYKPSRSGGFNLRTFDDILSDNLVKEALGEDFVNYLKILFTDPRGWNLRNKVCHGMLNPNMFNQETADRVLHSLLCLGLIQKKEKV
ncbi:MAG TPA: DUF4209 domain-containing protein [Candidatus Glassbacteria bacterium]|nr:DUF4209 domain-containing protein [Candidatus Glassbacteria bacterium]